MPTAGQGTAAASLKDIIVEVTAGLLRHLHIPEQEIRDFTGQVKEQKMGMLFENFEDFDFPAEKRKVREESLAEGRERLLTELICKKLQKGKSVLQIADELEEEEDQVKAVCQTAASVPGYDADRVWQIMHGET